jgi:hypothetical protein
MRDPRVDPQVGDIVKNGTASYQVVARDGDALEWRVAVDGPGWRRSTETGTLEDWSNPNDVVLHVAGEPADLRAQLEAVTAERDSARAELASWNADREEWRAKARAEGPKEPAEIPGWLSRNGWNILNDLPNGSQVWLHTSGLWCRVYDPVEEEDAWRAILTALSAAVDAGATGERVLVVGTRPWAELRVRE